MDIIYIRIDGNYITSHYLLLFGLFGGSIYFLRCYFHTFFGCSLFEMCAIGGGSAHLFGSISFCLFSIGCLLLCSTLVTNSQVKATMWQFITVSNILNWKVETRLISWAQGAQRSTVTDTRRYYLGRSRYLSLFAHLWVIICWRPPIKQ